MPPVNQNQKKQVLDTQSLGVLGDNQDSSLSGAQSRPGQIRLASPGALEASVLSVIPSLHCALPDCSDEVGAAFRDKRKWRGHPPLQIEHD